MDLILSGKSNFGEFLRFFDAPGSYIGEIWVQIDPIWGLELQKPMKYSPSMYLLVLKRLGMVR